MKPRIAVTRRLPEIVETELARDFDLQLNPSDTPYEAARLQALLHEADGVVCTVTDRFEDSMFSGPLRAKILANFGVGYDNIAVDAAKAAGVAVTNTPDVLTEDTADLTMALILAVARRMGEGERIVRGGRWRGWSPIQLLGSRVHGKTLGIVGFGRIGQAVARRAARGFGMAILVHSRRSPNAAALESLGATNVPRLEELLARSDFVSLHCPSTPATKNLLDESRLAAMRSSAFLINTARGDIVDEEALVRALTEGTIAGAGLDVYRDEPHVGQALREMEQVVLLPHLGSATVETRVAMGRRAADNLRAFFAGQPPPDRVV